MANRPKSKLNDAECVRLHKVEGKGTVEIARMMGCHPPAIYRAFQRMGYEYRFLHRAGRPCKTKKNPTETTPRRPREAKPVSKLDESLFPPPPGSAEYEPSHSARKMEAAQRVESRDPCGFCGVRGDLPCKHKRSWAA